MTSLLGDILGLSSSLCGKNHTDMGKFLKHHYGDHFLAISPLLAPQFLEDVLTIGSHMASIVLEKVGKKGMLPM